MYAGMLAGGVEGLCSRILILTHGFRVSPRCWSCMCVCGLFLLFLLEHTRIAAFLVDCSQGLLCTLGCWLGESRAFAVAYLFLHTHIAAFLLLRVYPHCSFDCSRVVVCGAVLVRVVCFVVVVVFLSCRVLCCSCCVFVCVTCCSSYRGCCVRRDACWGS